MGTRADFYVGRSKDAEWLGSIAWDGYPGGIPDAIKACHDEAEYRDAVEVFFAGRSDATRPADGWPWPWDDSSTTDYAYAFDDNEVWAFGRGWFIARGPEPEPEDGAAVRHDFPDMSSRKAVTYGKRSGLIAFG